MVASPVENASAVGTGVMAALSIGPPARTAVRTLTIGPVLVTAVPQGPHHPIANQRCGADRYSKSRYPACHSSPPGAKSKLTASAKSIIVRRNNSRQRPVFVSKYGKPVH